MEKMGKKLDWEGRGPCSCCGQWLRSFRSIRILASMPLHEPLHTLPLGCPCQFQTGAVIDSQTPKLTTVKYLPVRNITCLTHRHLAPSIAPPPRASARRWAL